MPNFRNESIFVQHDTISYFNVQSKVDISQLNLPYGTNN